MAPPLVCPPPPDCPLHDRRVNYGVDEPLRRAVLTERRRPGLTDLIHAEALTNNNGGKDRPARPVPKELPLPSLITAIPNLDHLKKGTN